MFFTIQVLSILVVSCLGSPVQLLPYNSTTCDLCPEALGQLASFFVEEPEVAAEIMILQFGICPQTPDASACEAQVALWWPSLAQAISSNPDMIPGMCEEIPDLCQQDWCCDVCKSRVREVASLSESPEHLGTLVSYLQANGFCLNPDIGIVSAEDCATVIGSFIPVAMPLLMEVMKIEDERICTDLYGIC